MMAAERRKNKILHTMSVQQKMDANKSKQMKSRDIAKQGGVKQLKVKGKLKSANENVKKRGGSKGSNAKTASQKHQKNNQVQNNKSRNNDSLKLRVSPGIGHKKGKMKKRKVNTDNKSGVGNKVNSDKLKVLMTLETKGMLKKPLTERQKHKLTKLKMKRKAGKIEEAVTEKTPSIKEPTIPPKTTEEVSSNWKKLQEKSVPDSRKRKLSQEKIRNPKYRKVDMKTTDAETGTAAKKPDIWFDDVDEFLIEGQSEDADTAKEKQEGMEKPNPLVKPEAFKGLTKAVAMDCEMVGVGDGTDNMVARVSIVNQHGEPIFDKYVKPKERVKDYRTHVSGIRPGDMEKGEDLEKVQKDVADILKGRILVGHAIQNDLQVLFLQHPRKKIRDTSRYKAFRRLFQGRTPSLKNLSSTVLHVKVQEGEHNSIQDAQAAMRLYTMFRKQWEAELKMKRIRGRGTAKTKT